MGNNHDKSIPNLLLYFEYIELYIEYIKLQAG